MIRDTQTAERDRYMKYIYIYTLRRKQILILDVFLYCFGNPYPDNDYRHGYSGIPSPLFRRVIPLVARGFVIK